MMPENAVSIAGLKVVYDGQSALDLESLEFEEGRIHILVGANGCGKTTLLRAVAGIERPVSGSVSVFGEDLYGLSRKEFLKAIRGISLCFQKPYLFNTSVKSNIEYGLRFRDLTAEEKRRRVRDAADALALGPFLERNAHGLSAGESQRVSVARLLAIRPKIALLDEPIANVDVSNKSRVESAVERLREGGSTVIVATHHMEQAYRLSANVVRLEDGRIAPPALENLIEGEIEEMDGLLYLVAGGVALSVASGKPGFARASIEPTAIIISSDKIHSSARNSLEGTVKKLSAHGGLVSLEVDAGVTFTAHITEESFNQLGINLGSKVYLTFKASAVTVF